MNKQVKWYGPLMKICQSPMSLDIRNGEVVFAAHDVRTLVLNGYQCRCIMHEYLDIMDIKDWTVVKVCFIKI